MSKSNFVLPSSLHLFLIRLMEVVNQLDKGDHFNLSLCGEYLVKHKQYFMAAEVYKKMGDVNKLISVYTMTCQWEEALKLIDEYPNLKQDVYVKYATWLAENDQFVEAQQGNFTDSHLIALV